MLASGTEGARITVLSRTLPFEPPVEEPQTKPPKADVIASFSPAILVACLVFYRALFTGRTAKRCASRATRDPSTGMTRENASCRRSKAQLVEVEELGE